MDWQLRPAGDPADPAGIGDLLARAQDALGGEEALRGTRFVRSTEEMLQQTREIEAGVLGADTTLYVGFQDGERLDGEAEVYRDLTASGTRVIAFGTGRPVECDCVEWIELEEAPLRLENQWLLVAAEPEPVALVGFEAPALGADGAGEEAKPWEGFVSTDPRLVSALVEHLDGVAAGQRAG